MKRKALLISPNFQDLPGVKADIDAWHSFLTSPMGGAWSESEICDTSKIITEGLLTWDILQPLVQDAFTADYIFIAFSGHGGTYSQIEDKYGLPVTYIYLNDRECVPEYNFVPKEYGKRCTILLDCCRTLDRNIPIIKTASVIHESALLLAKAMARKCFDEELVKCEFGLTRIYSTLLGHAAADIPSFTRCMIEGAKAQLIQSTVPDQVILNLKEAVDIAKKDLITNHEMQLPVYNAGRRRYHFPFAIISKDIVNSCFMKR